MQKIGSVMLAVLAGVISGTLIGAIVAVLQVKYKAADMVIGTSINLLVAGLTSIMLFLIYGKNSITIYIRYSVCWKNI